MGLLTTLYGIAADFGSGGKNLTPDGQTPNLRDELRSLKAAKHAPVANATALAAIGANDRADSMLVVKADDHTTWIFDAASTAAASYSVILPAVGTGRWIAKTGVITLLPGEFILATGAPTAIFADGASAVPGTALVDSKALGIRWNNNATLNAILTSFQMPADADISKDAYVYVRASKVGATVGDAVTFVLAVYNQVTDALHDADTNYGSTTDAMTGDAASKTIQEVTATLATANLAAYPATVSMTVKPTDGTLGTDDLVLHSVHIVYARKY